MTPTHGATAFRERFAQTMVESGMPRMAARAFSAILTSDEGKCSAAELAAELNVGPSAVSGAVKYLVQVGLIERGREPGTRRDYCRVHDDSWGGFMTQHEPTFDRIETVAAEGARQLGDDTPAGRRLDETSRFFAFMREEIRESMAKWQRLRRGDPESD